MPTRSHPDGVASTDDDQLLAAIQRLGRLMGSRKAIARITRAASTEMSQQGVQIVRVLHREGDLPVAVLARVAGMDLSAVSRQLSQLETAGFVERLPSELDRRTTIVALTPYGRRVANRLRTVGLRHLDAALDSWSASDRQQLGRLLTRLVDDLQATDVAPFKASRRH